MREHKQISHCTVIIVNDYGGTTDLRRITSDWCLKVTSDELLDNVQTVTQLWSGSVDYPPRRGFSRYLDHSGQQDVFKSDVTWYKTGWN